MLDKMEANLPAHEMGRHTRDDRKRAVGAGRKFDQSLAQRTVAVLSYLRLHIPSWLLHSCLDRRNVIFHVIFVACCRLLLLFYLVLRYGKS